MSDDDPVKQAKDGIAVVREIIKAAGDNENVKAASQELGKTALTITKAINNALLPLAAVNYGFQKAKEYFDTQFESDMEEKAKQIPPERLVDPKPSVAGPALQGLAFSHEEHSLKDMYLSLLKSAMDSETKDEAHPAFVEIIKQLSGEESQVLSLFIKDGMARPISELRSKKKGGQSWNILKRHVLELFDSDTLEPVIIRRLEAFIDNWIRLGLVEVDYSVYLDLPEAYKWVESRPEMLECKSNIDQDNFDVTIEKGIIRRTSLGAQFAETVGISVEGV